MPGTIRRQRSTISRQMPSTIRLFSMTALAAIGLGIGGMIGVMWFATQALPSFESLQDYQPSIVSRVYADNGEVIGQFYLERRIYAPLDRIPQHLVNAVIAVEDSRFFDHPGLDIIGIVRAAWTNIKKGGKFEGASTITQQLARSLFLSPERTYTRKIRELLLALKMEMVLSKEQILEMYLNQIYFGHGAYGVATASYTYFDKDISNLTLPEAAFLAGLPKAPNTYSPYRNPGLAKRRQEHVLRRMVDAGFLSKATAEEAMKADLTFRRHSLDPIAAYFLEDIRQTLVDHYGESMVFKGGLQVYTTLNVPMQRAAEYALRQGLRDLDKRQGWRGPLRHVDVSNERAQATALDNHEPTIRRSDDLLEAVVTRVSKDEAEVLVADTYKGRIALEDMLWARRQLPKGAEVTEARVLSNPTADRILKPGDVIEVAPKHGDPEEGEFVLEQTPRVEGALLALDPRTGAIRAMVGGYDYERSQFNRAVLARRQPGSAFKPIIYAAALKQGWTPATLILDAPVVYEEEDRVWKPENYEKRFYGAITLRDALRHSRNAATVRLLEQIGVENVISLAKALGVTSHLSPDLSLALGSSSVTLQELTSVYGVFANLGLQLKPYAISLVKNLEGDILEQHVFEPRRVLSPETAYLITNMLMDVIQRGTGRKAKSVGRPVAGKTGTTNSYHDAWFVGYAPNLVAGVWVGFDGMRTIGKLESGAHAALPIWTAFMKEALKPLPVLTFAIPEGIRFAEVDLETGAQPTELTKKREVEVFAAGTEPKKPSARKPTDLLDFYELDRLGEQSERRYRQ
ncbi:MAG: PBP1A family penicillin-binding protein [Nitrospirae bacterium]|nr:MAG: PBP1A family penicillin-binding protein [Nitrospirota bacterium]